MDERAYKNFSTWFQQVIQQVRFKPDHDAIRRELEAHYDDHCQDLRRLGYDDALAAERAIRALGDPAAVGKALDAAHKPWLGWLWMASRVLSIVCVLFTLGYFYIVAPEKAVWPVEDPDAWNGDYTQIAKYFWYSSEEETPEFWKNAHLKATGSGTAPMERGGYTLTVPYAEVREQVFGDQLARYYFVVLQVRDWYFWDKGPEKLADYLEFQDACGRYFNRREYNYTLDEAGNVIWGPADGLLQMHAVQEGSFVTTYYLSANVLAEEGHLGTTAELHYPYSTPWTMEIAWKEVPDA